MYINIQQLISILQKSQPAVHSKIAHEATLLQSRIEDLHKHVFNKLLAEVDIKIVLENINKIQPKAVITNQVALIGTLGTFT